MLDNGLNLRLAKAGGIVVLGIVVSLALAALAIDAPAQSTAVKLGRPQDTPFLPGPGQVLPVPSLKEVPQITEKGPAPGVFPYRNETQLVPIDLATALRLAGTNNLDISQAREVVNIAGLQLDKAKLLVLPTLNMGSTYTEHEGRIAKTEGNIIVANKDALFVGLGPSLNLSFADAIFAPLVARQVSAATQAGLRRVQNDTLLAVAETYFTVLRARRKIARVDVTLEYLTSDKASPIRAGSKGLLPVVETINKAGAAEALKSEVDRVQIEVLRRQEERTAAVQEFQVAVAELARLLRLRPDLQLWSMVDFRAPLDIPGPWYDMALDELVMLAMNNRPELAENQALVLAAGERVRAAQFRPWLPNLVMNYSWGDFGGGPNQNPNKVVAGKSVAQPGFGPSGEIHHMGTRSDFDAGLLWRFQSLGFGNLVELREQQTLARQANIRQIQIQEQIITQIVQVDELIKGWKGRVAITQSALFDRDGKPNGPVFDAIRLNFQRVREVEKTRPLEVLDAIRSLSDMLESYGQDITDYDRSRFRLMIIMGLPPDEIIHRISVPTPASVPPPK